DLPSDRAPSPCGQASARGGAGKGNALHPFYRPRPPRSLPMRLVPLLCTSLLALGACDGGTQGAGVTVEETPGEAAPMVEPTPAAGAAGASTAPANPERAT